MNCTNCGKELKRVHFGVRGTPHGIYQPLCPPCWEKEAANRGWTINTKAEMIEDFEGVI